MYGHIEKLAQAELKGIEAAGGKADLYQYDLPRSSSSCLQADHDLPKDPRDPSPGRPRQDARPAQVLRPRP